MRAAAVLLLGLALAAAAAGLAAETSLIEWEGKDQHDRPLAAAHYQGRPLLVLWGDRKGSEYMLAWSRALSDSTASSGPDRLDVAHGRGAPFFVKGKIKKRFRRDDDRAVLMDWDGCFQEAYACAPDSGTVLLFGADGVLRRRWTVGAVGDSTLAAIRQAAGEVMAP